jgi:hypothetical protein
LKSRHVDARVNDEFLDWLKKTYGNSKKRKVQVTRGEHHDYLGNPVNAQEHQPHARKATALFRRGSKLSSTENLTQAVPNILTSLLSSFRSHTEGELLFTTW